MISQSSIERIQEIPIYDVISQFIDLKKNGPNSWKAKSPWNNERTPSFYVVRSKNIFKDFSSGKGGDGIKFVMEYENCSYVEAIEKIAAKTGERIEYDRPATPEEKEQLNEREQLYKINQAAANRYAGMLLDVDGAHPAFQELINKRRFTADTILQWHIGYAPDEWQFLTSTLKEKALVGEGKKLGLVREKEERVYDAFRNRVIYPIWDHHGRIVTFGGGRLSPDVEPKYLNGSESPIYNKSKTLYGLNFAQHALRKHGYAYLMEGYTDVISFHQAGFTCAIGTCGTELTEGQCKLLKKYCNKVILLPDHDKNEKGEIPGERAALKNIDRLMSEGFEVQVVPLPDTGKKIDPDELVRMFPPNNDSL